MSAFYEIGQYLVKAKDHGFGETEIKQTPFFWLKFTVLGFEKHGEFHEVQQYERTLKWYLTQKTSEFVAEKLRELGFQSDDCTGILNESIECMTFDLYCKHETGEDGQSYEKWDLPFKGTPIDPIDDGKLSKLDALFGKFLAKAPKQGQSTNELVTLSVGSDSSSNSIPNDDIPF